MHPRKHRRVRTSAEEHRTSAEEHRTPVSTSPELLRRHAGSPGWVPGPPLREVRALARSRDGEDPGTGKGPVDAFPERQTLNKNRGGALCTGADGPRPGARRGGTLCAGADCPRPGAGRSAAWCVARASLPDGRTVRALGAGRSARTQRRWKSPAAPGSRSREGPRRGGEILGGV
jgi:hypothetical protein